MTPATVAALAVVGWVFAIVAIWLLCVAAKEAEQRLTQAHGYRREADRLLRENDVLNGVTDVFIGVAIDISEGKS